MNSLGINLARAIGPALAGIVVAASGPQAAFMLNAVSSVGVIVVLLRWPRVPSPSTLPAERFTGALRAGLRYVREATALQHVMGRAAAFFVFSSATWALLPLVARNAGGGANTYGLLLAGIGAGAVGTALVMPALRRRCSRDVLVRGATVVYAVATLGVALAGSLAVLLPAVLACGAAWLALLSTLHVSAQTAVPQWVRAVGLSDGLCRGHDRRRGLVGYAGFALGRVAGIAAVRGWRSAGDAGHLAADAGRRRRSCAQRSGCLDALAGSCGYSA